MLPCSKFVCFFSLCVFVISCSKEATPNGPGNGGNGNDPSPVTECNSQAQCPGQVCDFNFPTGSSAGQCRAICPASGNCPDSQVCSPISGACEPNCSTSEAICNPIKGFCTIAGFCAIASASGSDCPSNFTLTNGFCKFSSSTGCAGSNMTKDAVTNTCEQRCTPGAASCPQTVQKLSPQPTITYVCSPITATCVAGCATGQTSCADPIRSAPLTLKGTCSCELGCDVSRFKDYCLNSNKKLVCERPEVGPPEVYACTQACTTQADCSPELQCLTANSPPYCGTL